MTIEEYKAQPFKYNGYDGDCRRMKIWDTKHGFEGVEFKLQEIL